MHRKYITYPLCSQFLRPHLTDLNIHTIYYSVIKRRFWYRLLAKNNYKQPTSTHQPLLTNGPIIYNEDFPVNNDRVRTLQCSHTGLISWKVLLSLTQVQTAGGFSLSNLHPIIPSNAPKFDLNPTFHLSFLNTPSVVNVVQEFIHMLRRAMYFGLSSSAVKQHRNIKQSNRLGTEILKISQIPWPTRDGECVMWNQKWLDEYKMSQEITWRIIEVNAWLIRVCYFVIFVNSNLTRMKL